MLPEYNGLSRENFRGRNPYEGYQRACGIRYAKIIEQAKEDEVFVEAWTLAQSRSVVSPFKLTNLYLLVRYFLPRLDPSDIIEFGTFRGGSAMFLAKLAQAYLPGIRIFGLDSFAGMPKTDKTIDGHNAGDFSETSLEDVEMAKNNAGLDNLTLVKGLFSDTTAGVLEQCKGISLAHIDCDLYHPALAAFEDVRLKMVPGGYIVFDDALEASCLGAMQAVEDIVEKYRLRCEQVDPHIVFRYPPI